MMKSFPPQEEQASSDPVVSLNHVSFLCSSLQDSVRFYRDVLGFQLIKRPSSFDFEGAWLYNYGIGIHLLQRRQVSGPEAPPQRPTKIDPKGNHISFQCGDVGAVRRRLDDMGIDYVTAVVEDGGVKVDQLFFHDPDYNMIEICDCHKIPVVPLYSPIPLEPPALQSSSSIRSNCNFRRYHSFAGCAVPRNSVMGPDYYK